MFLDNTTHCFERFALSLASVTIGECYRTAFVKLLAVALSLYWSGAAAAQAAPPEWVELRSEIFGLGGTMHIATDRTRIVSKDGRYTITADVKSIGLANLLVDLTSHSEVTGFLTSDRLQPEAYRGEVRRNGDIAQNWVTYEADGSAIGGTFQPAHPSEPLPAGPLTGTLDQLSTFYQVERTLARTGSCTYEGTVFDGRRLYRLHFSDADSALLKRADGDAFSGPTRLCRFQRTPLAGFTDKNGRSEGIFEGKVWYARLLGDNVVVPVRMMFGTEFGSVSGELAELRAPGVDWRLEE